MAGFGMGTDGMRDRSVYKLDQSHRSGIRIALHLLPEAQHYRRHGNKAHFKLKITRCSVDSFSNSNNLPGNGQQESVVTLQGINVVGQQVPIQQQV
jgi:hypothetical protein